MNRLKEIFLHFGIENQKKKLIEECSELITAICKNDEDNIVEEMADAELVISEFKAFYPEIEKSIEKTKQIKTNRTIERIKEKYYEKEMEG